MAHGAGPPVPAALPPALSVVRKYGQIARVPLSSFVLSPWTASRGRPSVVLAARTRRPDASRRVPRRRASWYGPALVARLVLVDADWRSPAPAGEDEPCRGGAALAVPSAYGPRRLKARARRKLGAGLPLVWSSGRCRLSAIGIVVMSSAWGSRDLERQISTPARARTGGSAPTEASARWRSAAPFAHRRPAVRGAATLNAGLRRGSAGWRCSKGESRPVTGTTTLTCDLASGGRARPHDRDRGAGDDSGDAAATGSLPAKALAGSGSCPLTGAARRVHRPDGGRPDRGRQAGQACESFKAGKARLTFVVPKTAKASSEDQDQDHRVRQDHHPPLHLQSALTAAEQRPTLPADSGERRPATLSMSVHPAGAAGLEPATPGFGDRCSTN